MINKPLTPEEVAAIGDMTDEEKVAAALKTVAEFVTPFDKEITRLEGLADSTAGGLRQRRTDFRHGFMSGIRWARGSIISAFALDEPVADDLSKDG